MLSPSHYVRHLFVSACLCSPIAAGAGVPCSYDAELLWGQTCGFFGPANVSVGDIAPDGTIVGIVEQCIDPALDEGFVWPAIDDPFIIPRPDGVAYLRADCINRRGQVGVFMSQGFGGYVYDTGTETFTSIGVPPGGNHSIPYGINDGGHVAGEWGNNQVGPVLQAFFWNGAQLLDLTPLLFGPRAIAFGINDNDEVVGWSGVSPTGPHTAFWWHDGRATDLGPIPGGTISNAWSINELSQIVVTGSILNPSGSGMVGRSFVWQKGAWTELDLLAGYAGCDASDINDNGQVIGSCTNPGTTDKGFYLWEDGVMTDIGPLIPATVGEIEFETKFLAAINNAGQIAAYGTAWHPLHGPSQVGLRLTPKFQSPADFTGDCHVDANDLAILLASWGPLGKRNATSAADLDGNGIVNGFDLALLLAAWG